MSATGCIATMRQNGNLKHGLIIAEADDKETVDQASSMDIDIVSTPFLMKELLWAVAGILGNNHDPKKHFGLTFPGFHSTTCRDSPLLSM